LVAGVSLFATYAAQEWLEGAFAAGHPAGLAGVVGHGGLWALPLSAVFGAVVAALLRLAAAAVELVSRAIRARILAAPAVVRLPAPVAVRRSPLAGGSAGRAPPVALFAA
jgi:hypothetical protein